MEGGCGAGDGRNYLVRPDLPNTGLAAYNYGMAIITAALLEQDVFISHSVAPPFPSQYAHSRRVGNDQMYGGVEYSINCIGGGGWWLSKLYRQDPDLVVFGRDVIKPVLKPFDPLWDMDGQSRVNKAIVAGGLLLAGDNFTNVTSIALARKYLGNALVNAVMRLGVTFRPVESNHGLVAATLLEMVVPDGVVAPLNASGFLCLFNFDPLLRHTTAIDLSRLAHPLNRAQSATNVWTGETVPVGADSKLPVDIATLSSILLALHVK